MPSERSWGELAVEEGADRVLVYGPIGMGEEGEPESWNGLQLYVCVCISTCVYMTVAMRRRGRVPSRY